MEAMINTFRMGRHTHQTNQMIISIKSIDNKEKAEKLVGKKVSWKSPKGTEIKGEIRAIHGNNGALRVLFEKGMPGQAVGTKVEVI
ncbi:MAG: 50S ribosomal protein L35ae [Candidatus Nanoarchaeia archaeon]|nr:50S ribosomal protein L35ae [Candidatus Nanoarchaeia archaeon]